MFTRSVSSNPNKIDKSLTTKEANFKAPPPTKESTICNEEPYHYPIIIANWSHIFNGKDVSLKKTIQFNKSIKFNLVELVQILRVQFFSNYIASSMQMCNTCNDFGKITTKLQYLGTIFH